MSGMRFSVRSVYDDIPQDLEEEYNKKIKEANVWLEGQLIERNISPNKMYFVMRNNDLHRLPKK